MLCGVCIYDIFFSFLFPNFQALLESALPTQTLGYPTSPTTGAQRSSTPTSPLRKAAILVKPSHTW